MRWILALILTMAALPAWACGVDSDCKLGDRVYRIYLPKRTGTAPIGAIIFAHGYRGNAAQIMDDKSLIAVADELGVALVAPQAIDEGWHLPGRPRHKDYSGKEEFTYFRNLVDDIAKRFPIDRHKLLAAGFSSGGMMVWNLACYEGDLFAGFAPISGTFWSPVPQNCPSKSVNLIHFHGTSDPVVPLDGRVIADGKQGEVDRALALFTKIGHFAPELPLATNDLNCWRRKNPDGKVLEFCTHPGGHEYKAEYVRRAWRELHIADH